MHDSPIKIRDLILAFLFSLIIIICLFFGSYFNRTTKIVFCDVGQGDAAYIRIKNKIDVLIDAGPDKKILNCLGRHMPFWDRTLEMVVMTHPQSDHYGGLIEVFRRYNVGIFLAPSVDNSTQGYQVLKDLVKASQAQIVNPQRGMKMR